MNIFIEAIGIQAAGLNGWDSSVPILKNQQPWQQQPLPKYNPAFLPANERRRATNTIKLALLTAQDCVNQLSDIQIQTLPSLFCSVDGDTEISAKILNALNQPEVLVSPIDFHNSVHNAAAGYWMIGHKNTTATSAISAGKYQIAHSLLESFCLLNSTYTRLLCVLYDSPPDPFFGVDNMEQQTFGCGFVFSQLATANSLAQLSFNLGERSVTHTIDHWFPATPLASILALFKAVAQGHSDSFYYPLSESQSMKLKLFI